MHLHALKRYEIELDVIERRPELDDRAAIALLRDEFALAINASHFIALSEDDPAIAIASRTVPQEGVARYALTFEFTARPHAGSEGEIVALLHSEFQRAINASQLWRVCTEDPTVTILTGERAGSLAQLRHAA
ncbi:MAG: hypothetical protein QOE11_3533 [Solirubrobacteraceae bacterium]|jgi:hypothetical protein|nr:hypothetical protein [Solirubrobacteraceae bacterium]